MTPEQIRAVAAARKAAADRKASQDPNKARAMGRARAAKAGALEASPESLARAEEANSMMMQGLRDNAGLAYKVGDNLIGYDDGTMSPGEKVGSLLNKAGESATFGVVGDEASAALESLSPGVDYASRRDHYRKQEAQLERENPGLSLAADIGGGVAGAMLPAGMAGTLARGAGVIPRVLASTAAGSAGAGTYGFMEGEGLKDRADKGKSGAAMGAIVGALAPVVGGAVQKVADSNATRRVVNALRSKAPSTDELRRMGQDAYRQIDQAGVQINPAAFDRLRQGMQTGMRGVGLDELPGPGSLTPKSARVNQIAGEMSGQMAQDPTAALPFSSLDQLRRHAGNAAADVAGGKATPDAKVGMEAISQIDDFVKGLSPSDVVSGDVQKIQTLIPKARDLWARMSRSQKIDDAIENADTYLSGGASGIRNQFARILRNPKMSKGFSEAEIQLMKRVAKGSLPEQILYLASSGLGNLGAIGLGAATGGPIGAIAGTGAALGLRKAAEGLAGRNAEIARAVIAAGGIKNLPVASDANRRITEALMRRGAAVGAQ